MARTIQDENFLTWEVYPSGGHHGYSERPYLVFNCLTDRFQRPRLIELDGDASDAQTLTVRASEPELLDLLRQARVKD
jgi:hypothetical protein